MAIREVIRMGHPTLLQAAVPVNDPTGPEMAALLEDMLDTLEEQQGVGLAAPQIGVSRRVVIFYVPGERGDDDEAEVPLTVLINPWIEPVGEDTDEAFEACLSVPGLTGLVPRWRHIRYGGIDRDGKAFEREGTGFHARVVQHECDHLDGVLYPMRIEDLDYFGYAEEIRRRFMDEEGAEAEDAAQAD